MMTDHSCLVLPSSGKRSSPQFLPKCSAVVFDRYFLIHSPRVVSSVVPYSKSPCCGTFVWPPPMMMSPMLVSSDMSFVRISVVRVKASLPGPSLNHVLVPFFLYECIGSGQRFGHWLSRESAQ